jgi:nucleotide-binding universal stress UspA family protein
MEFGKQCQARQRRAVHGIRMKTMMIRNILVPIDFSEMSIEAIKTATRLARRFGASVHLAHVRQFAYASGFLPAPPMDPFPVMPNEQDAEKNAAKDLHVLARDCDVPSATCHAISGGPAFDEICRVAQNIAADLIVMPTHGRTGLKHVFLGSTAERIVQHSPCPVFVVREKKRRSKTGPLHSINTILVPVDFSDCSREGLQYAIGFANEFGTRIILLHATYLGYIYSSEGTAIYDIPALQKAARKDAQRHMRQLVRSVNFEGVKFETAFTDGSPASDICAFAKDHDVDLIVTSTHGLTGLKHALIGSVAEQVVRRAFCSVLVVPSHPQTRMAKLKPDRHRAQKKPGESPDAVKRPALTYRETEFIT